MAKTKKWFKSFFSSKKDTKAESAAADKINNVTAATVAVDTTPISVISNSTTGPLPPPPPPPKEKGGRWSFRRPSTATAPTPRNSINTGEIITAEEQHKHHHALAVAAATAAAADAAVAAAQAAAAVVRLTAANASGTPSIIEEAAAIKIQSAYRSYLARKALRALKGLVKLQALVRGHLVRKQAKATLRCMQTLVTLQAKVLAQRVRTTSNEDDPTKPHMMMMMPTNRNLLSPNRSRFQQIQHVVDKALEENIKIVEMDVGESRGNRKNTRKSSYSADEFSAAHQIDDFHTSITPRTNCFDDYNHNNNNTSSFRTAQSSPGHYSSSASLKNLPLPPPPPMSNNNPFCFPDQEYADSVISSYDYYPSYMANTQSSRAKARSQSAPKQRPADTAQLERQPSRRRPSVEGRSNIHNNNIPRSAVNSRMQRSSSNLSCTAQNYFHCPPPPWALKLDRSAMSVRDSECDSVSTMLTNTEYCRSLIGYELGNIAYSRKAGGGVAVATRF